MREALTPHFTEIGEKTQADPPPVASKAPARQHRAVLAKADTANHGVFALAGKCCKARDAQFAGGSTYSSGGAASGFRSASTRIV